MKGKTLASRETFSLPDLHFYKWCGLTYGINRGVYNTLDVLLYEKGFKDVYERRLVLISFLEYSLMEDLYDEKRKAIKFGRGNLTVKLTEFVNSHA